MTSTHWGSSDLISMFKVLFASLLAGVAALFACLYLLYFLTTPGDAQTGEWAWDHASGQAGVGTASLGAAGLTLTLDETGRGVFVLPLPALEARLYPVLHLQFSAAPAADSLGVFWRTAQTGDRMAQFWVPGTLEESLWLPMAGMDVWDGQLVELALLVQGAPGSELSVESIRLLPGSPHNQLRAFWVDWQAFVPWGLASTNRYAATRTGQSVLYPVPVAAALLAASLLAYGLILLLSKATRFDWRVPGFLFLFAWICLDLVWQEKLWRQLALTQEKYAGKNDMEKLASGPDAGLVQFTSYVRQRLDDSSARVLVGSSDDYRGMRANYYLYPLNVFWHRHQSELPASQYIRAGDYIVLVNPSEVRFDRGSKVLLSPGIEPVKVQLLAESDVGNLYQVM